MFKSIFTRLFWNNLIIVLTALTALVFTLMLLFNDYITDRQFNTDMKAAENIEYLTVYLQIENPDVRNYPIYKSMLSQYSDFAESEITVVDATGSVFASTNSIDEVPDDMKDAVLGGNTIKNRSTFGNAYNNKVFVVGVPITYHRRVVGGIFFHTQIPEMQGRLKEYSFMLLMSCTFSILIACVLSFIQGRRITSPIKEINKGVMELASGNFEKRIAVTPDEIGQLASSFNFMADSLEKLERMRAGFVSDISHELRTPMTSISGFVGGILDGTIPEEKQKEYLQIVYDESVRLTKLTNDMLEMTKMQSSEYKLDISEFDINELIRICIIQLEQKIDAKNLELEVNFEPDRINVLADKDAIKRVIINILDNAIKFSFENTKVIVSAKIVAKKANISIGNFGAGINEDEIASVFDRFYKTDKSRSEDKKGAGLGLSLAKNIMNLHKQKIWVSSYAAKEGTNVKFTNFTFTLDLS